jgi:hypothetical protein
MPVLNEAEGMVLRRMTISSQRWVLNVVEVILEF